MKKFILLFLILPLTLMARPEKKWLQQPVAAFLGSLQWSSSVLADDNCDWVDSTNTAGNWEDFPQDTDCSDIAGAVTKVGNLVSSDISVNSDDIEYPQIKFSKIPKGVVRCEARGMIYHAAAASAAQYSFYDGTNRGYAGKSFASSAAATAPTVQGEIVYETDQTDVTIKLQYKLEVSNQIVANYLRNSQSEDFKIACYWHPIYPDNLSLKFR